MADFLSGLGQTISNQFGLGENNVTGLNGSMDGSQIQDYGLISKNLKFDRSAQRMYIEDGFINTLRPRERTIVHQQPEVSLIVKKRMFCSLVDNSRLDLLEEKERLLITASKKLFQNKCLLIGAYERLTYIERYTEEAGSFNMFLGPETLSAIEAVKDYISISSNTLAAFDTLRKILSYSNPNNITNWTTNDYDSVFGKSVGEGPGTIEFTTISSFSTNTSVEFGQGSASLNFEDPYNIMVITEADIDQALSDVSNSLATTTFSKFSTVELQNVIQKLKNDLIKERASRNVSQISFIISEGTLISKRVRAIIDEVGAEINFNFSNGLNGATSSYDGLFGGGTVEIDPNFLGTTGGQLSPKEADLFSQIIVNTFTLIGYRSTSQARIKQRNAEQNYARNRMLLMFNGKYIVQPMDTVEVFLKSNTSQDPVLSNNAYNANSISEKFNTVFKNINEGLYNLTNSFSQNGISSFDDIEKNALLGPDFPTWLWRLTKSNITSQSAGTAVFVGLVKNVSGRSGDGKHTLSVSCEDNCKYFDKGQVNFKPSVDVFNSTIYDPLTPFDVSFDASTGVAQTNLSQGDFPPLLPENQKLLQTGALIFRTGPNKGDKVTEDKYKTKEQEPFIDSFHRVLHDPAGLVYRWKQGIQTLTKSGRPYPQSSTEEERAILLTNSPFAGQDVMNVLSSLITGQPYNYGNFLKAAIANGNSIGYNSNNSGKAASVTYIEGLLSDIQKNNAIWGNFIPFKRIITNSEYDKLNSSGAINFINQNSELNSLLLQRAQLQDEVAMVSSSFAADPASAYSVNEDGAKIKNAQDTQVTKLQQRLQQLDAQITAAQTKYTNSINNDQNVGVMLIGDQVYNDPNYIKSNNPTNNQKQKDIDDLDLRRKLRQLTLRRFWAAKANQDQNLFIVDDQYDKNFDIQAFERKISAGNNISILNSEYSTVTSMIESTAKLLGLEIFANTQGHIEVRPPQYNKIPSSVFYKMFQDRDVTGIKVFPDFLESLLFNQLKGLIDRIEINEDEIRLRAIALGANYNPTSDSEIIKLLTNGSSGKISASNDFDFVTFPGTGKISEDLRSIIFQSNPDISVDTNNNALKTLGGSKAKYISRQAGIKSLFNTVVQTDVINATISNNIGIITTNAEPIRDRLRNRTGTEPPTINQLFSNKNNRSDKSLSQVDRLNIVSQLANLVSERQILIRSTTNALKNLRDGLSINAVETNSSNLFSSSVGSASVSFPNDSISAGKTATTPWLYKKSGFPQPLDHMIEYEDDDDVGTGSGKRFYITGDMYSSLSISENPPKYTMVTVNGLFGQGFVSAPGSLQTSIDGNAITSAYAVDYDMWYQYGFRASNAIAAPFFSDPDSQCAPYAVATLIKMRENILSGSIEMKSYNEFYQPGDVVYIEDRNLLFYVTAISHSFNYGTQLSTTLTLAYGHAPGIYIPNMLDLVGKILYNSKGFSGQFRNVRYDTDGADRPLGVIVYTQGSSTPTDQTTTPVTEVGDQQMSDGQPAYTFDEEAGMQSLVKGSLGERNKSVLSQILFAVSGSLNQASFGRSKAVIKIRYYGNLLEPAKLIKSWLLNPTKFSQETQQLVADDLVKNTYGLNTDDIVIESVDIKSQTYSVEDPLPTNQIPSQNSQGPSSAAWGVARELVGNGSSSETLLTSLQTNILDIFISYTDQTAQLTAMKQASVTQSSTAKAASTASGTTVSI